MCKTKTHALDILFKFGMTNAHLVTNLICSNDKLSKLDDQPLQDSTHYISIIGSFQYLTITQPDLTYSVGNSYNFKATPLMFILRLPREFFNISKVQEILDFDIHHPMISRSEYLQM